VCTRTRRSINHIETYTCAESRDETCTDPKGPGTTSLNSQPRASPRRANPHAVVLQPGACEDITISITATTEVILLLARP